MSDKRCSIADMFIQAIGTWIWRAYMMNVPKDVILEMVDAAYEGKEMIVIKGWFECRMHSDKEGVH